MYHLFLAYAGKSNIGIEPATAVLFFWLHDAPLMSMICYKELTDCFKSDPNVSLFESIFVCLFELYG